MPFTDDPEFNEGLEREVMRYIQAGDKLGAAQVYVDTVGASVTDALAEVERVAAAATGGSSVSRSQPHSQAYSGLNEQEVVRLLATEGKIAAVKYYRDQTAASLAEAKAGVEAIEERHAGAGLVTKKSGCLGVVIAMVSAVVSLFAKA